MRRRILPVLAGAVALSALLFAARALFVLPDVADAAATIDVCVLDGRTDQPLKNAVVVIPELDRSFAVGRDGNTGRIDVDLAKTEPASKTLGESWREVTLLVYCEGYYPVALFHTPVWENRNRSGPTIYLFADDGSMREPFTLIESPPDDWARALLERYNPLS